MSMGRPPSSTSLGLKGPSLHMPQLDSMTGRDAHKNIPTPEKGGKKITSTSDFSCGSSPGGSDSSSDADNEEEDSDDDEDDDGEGVKGPVRTGGKMPSGMKPKSGDLAGHRLTGGKNIEKEDSFPRQPQARVANTAPRFLLPIEKKDDGLENIYADTSQYKTMLSATVEDMDSEIFDHTWADPDYFKDIPAGIGLSKPAGELSNNTFIGDRVAIDSDTSGTAEDDDDPFWHDVSAESKPTVLPDNAWDSDSSEDAALAHFFYSSTEGEESDIGSKEGTQLFDFPLFGRGEAAESERGDTTDEEDVRMSDFSTMRTYPSMEPPQLVDVGADKDDDKSLDTPKLFRWKADPTRPICLVEGSKKTCYLPLNSAYYRDYQEAALPYSTDLFYQLDESEFEHIGTDDFSMMAIDNVSDIAGSEDYDVMDEDEEDVELEDPHEQKLKICDFVISDSEADSEDDDYMGEGSCGDLLLQHFSKVGVTAFRKRQDQHHQRLGMNNSSEMSGGGNRARDANLSATIGTTKRKRVRRKFLASQKSDGGIKKSVCRDHNSRTDSVTSEDLELHIPQLFED